MKATITQLISYPIKSCAGIRHKTTALTAMGLTGDRQLMLVDEKGVFISQRKHPHLALVQPSITAEGLNLKAPGMPPLTVQMPINSDDLSDRLVEVSIWHDDLQAETISPTADQWFSNYLKFPVKLVRYGQQSHRAVESDYARNSETVAFADGFPFLVAHEASLNDLNQALSQTVNMDRFRPNIVVKSEQAPWDELNWQNLESNEFSIDLVKPCTRCVMTGVDQAKGIQTGTEVLMTLKNQFAHKDKAIFGINSLARLNDDKPTEIQVGQIMHVLTN